MTDEPQSVLRAAAKLMRQEVAGHPFPERQLPATIRATADWLDAEAATRSEMEPFADLINATISSKGGPESYIRFGRNGAGEIAMVTDTLDAALAVAHAYLGTEPPPASVPEETDQCLTTPTTTTR